MVLEGARARDLHQVLGLAGSLERTRETIERAEMRQQLRLEPGAFGPLCTPVPHRDGSSTS